MSNSDKLFGELIGNVVATVGWLQDMENIVSIVCCIVGLVITVITCVIVPVWKKILDAKKDGKITPDELGGIADTLQEGNDKNKQGDKKKLIT